MTPTLAGRLQTRVLLAASVGAVWTAAVTPFLPAATYRVTFASLAVMTLLGLGWEVVYHIAQQARWDKDWPSLVALVTLANEAVAVWFAVHALEVIPGSMLPPSPFLPGFLIHVSTTWLVIWLFQQGPIRVLLPRWRFDGGLLLPVPGCSRRLRETAVAGWQSSRPAMPSRPSEGIGTDGVACDQGHVGPPDGSHCAVCGTALTAGADLRAGPRRPLGVLILPDGRIRTVDSALEIAPAEGDPLVRARIEPVGWQPVLISPAAGVEVALPGGSRLRAGSDVPVPLVPGTELVIGGQSIRFESPYQAYDPGPAHTAQPVPKPKQVGLRAPRSATRPAVVAAATIVVVTTVLGALATGVTVAVGALGLMP